MTTHTPGTLHFIAGKPGAGKTTLARRLADAQGLVLFCEDEWLVRLFEGAATLAEYLQRRARIREVLTRHVPALLRGGVSVVFDFAGNTPSDRAWVRTLCEAAGAPHLLHVIEAEDALCRQRILERNRTKPEGVYWGELAIERFDELLPYLSSPGASEGLNIVQHTAETL